MPRNCRCGKSHALPSVGIDQRAFGLLAFERSRPARLGGGWVPFITQSRSATRMPVHEPGGRAPDSPSACPLPQLLPGQLGAGVRRDSRSVCRCRRRAWSSAGSSGARCRAAGCPFLRIGADPGRGHLQREHLRAAEGLDDLRAGARCACSGRGCRRVGRCAHLVRELRATTAGLRCPSGRARARRRAGPSASCWRRAARR